MPRVEVIGEYTASWGKRYLDGHQIGVTDEEYQANKDKLKFLSPTTDRSVDLTTGQVQEVARKDSKP